MNHYKISVGIQNLKRQQYELIPQGCSTHLVRRVAYDHIKRHVLLVLQQLGEINLFHPYPIIPLGPGQPCLLLTIGEESYPVNGHHEIVH